MVTAYTFPKPDPLVDPFGNRQITYQTDRGRVLSSTAVLSASFGDVFSGAQNGVVNVTRNQYDGLDRLTQTTLPEGGAPPTPTPRRSIRGPTMWRR